MLVLLTGGVVAGVGAPACACSCAPGSEQEFTEWADLVFVGVVVDIDRPTLVRSSADQLTARLVVESVLKGQAGDQVDVKTALEGPSCGFEFVLGTRYRVYSRDGETNVCAGNRALGAAPEVPLQDAPTASTVWAPAGAAVLLLAIGGWWWLRRPGRAGPPQSRPGPADQTSAQDSA